MNRRAFLSLAAGVAAAGLFPYGRRRTARGDGGYVQPVGELAALDHVDRIQGGFVVPAEYVGELVRMSDELLLESPQNFLDFVQHGLS